LKYERKLFFLKTTWSINRNIVWAISSRWQPYNLSTPLDPEGYRAV